jgi:Rod binding domain-containing protein
MRSVEGAGAGRLLGGSSAAGEAATALARLPALPEAAQAAGTTPLDKPALGRAAQEFEGVFLRMLLQVMLPEDGGGLFGSGPAAGVVRGMFVDQVGDALSRQRSLGLADLVEGDMARTLSSQNERPRALGKKVAPVDLQG